jgi:acyl-CoA synthetase (AMP-forming)/AMP-acid ligase II
MASLVKLCPRNPEPWSARGFAAGSWPALRHRSSEIEFALELQPGVSQAAVVGVPSRRWGEEVVAVIVPSQEENFDPERILIGVRKQLSPYRCPKRIVAVAALPRNTMGKLVRRELVDVAGVRGPAE